ncbi:MAG: hypothetical protein ACYTHK_19175 [Planctomycetota bacterium]|jgi:hypothetical protein
MKWMGILACLMACSSPPPDTRPLIEAPPAAKEVPPSEPAPRPREREPATVEEARAELEAARLDLIHAERTYTPESERVRTMRAKCDRLQRRYKELKSAH